LGEEKDKEKNAATQLAELLNLLGLAGKGEIELEDVDLQIGELILQPSALAPAALEIRYTTRSACTTKGEAYNNFGSSLQTLRPRISWAD